MYGLKQSLRQWYKRFDSLMTTQNLTKSSYDSFVYFRKAVRGPITYLPLYVDDMLILAKDKAEGQNDKGLALSSLR